MSDKKARQPKLMLERRATTLAPETEWWTPEEAATYLRVSAKLVYTLAKSDPTFPAVKLTNVLRIRRARLERWLDAHQPARRRAEKQVVKLPAPTPNPLELKVLKESTG